MSASLPSTSASLTSLVLGLTALVDLGAFDALDLALAVFFVAADFAALDFEPELDFFAAVFAELSDSEDLLRGFDLPVDFAALEEVFDLLAVDFLAVDDLGAPLDFSADYLFSISCSLIIHAPPYRYRLYTDNTPHCA